LSGLSFAGSGNLSDCVAVAHLLLKLLLLLALQSTLQNFFLFVINAVAKFTRVHQPFFLA
jgi:hypothetical protein